jgi:hypothetical protein
MKDKIKIVKKKIRRIFKRENIIKAIVLISGLLLVLTSILPYIL